MARPHLRSRLKRAQMADSQCATGGMGSQRRTTTWKQARRSERAGGVGEEAGCRRENTRRQDSPAQQQNDVTQPENRVAQSKRDRGRRNAVNRLEGSMFRTFPRLQTIADS